MKPDGAVKVDFRCTTRERRSQTGLSSRFNWSLVVDWRGL